jgi:hypothetical protein
VSIAERAILELLYEAGTRQSLEEARNLFDGLRAPRMELLGHLLACCRSVKAVRLFLAWARETHLLDVDDLLAKYSVRTGSDKRWMSRLDDGTLLSLRPHGCRTFQGQDAQVGFRRNRCERNLGAVAPARES